MHLFTIQSFENKPKHGNIASPWLSRHFKSFSVILALLYSLCTNGTIKTVVGNSALGWNTASNWAPAGVPQSGDVVIIPATFTLTLKNSIYSSPLPLLTIQIFGTLDFEPAGKLDLASNSILNIYGTGQITTHGSSSELINIGGVNKFNGQLDGDISGPRFASSSTGESPNGFNSGVLAIRLSSFSAKLINDQVKLSWSAIHDNPDDRFEIQRNSGAGWMTLAGLPSSGTMNTLNEYFYTDAQPIEGINLYRIKLISTNAPENYSKTVSVSLLGGIESVSVFPNPTRSATTITWNKDRNGAAMHVQVHNTSMNLVFYKQIPSGENSFYLDVSQFPSGLYTITVTNHTGLKETAKILVN